MMNLTRTIVHSTKILYMEPSNTIGVKGEKDRKAKTHRHSGLAPRIRTMPAVKSEVIKKLLEDSEWLKSLEGTETFEGTQKVITGFAKAKDYKAKPVAR